MDKHLLIATRNPKKQKELEELLTGAGWNIFTLLDFPECPEVLEDGETFMENAEKKAKETSLYTGMITLADDSGLVVDALDGRPGIYSARYAKGEDSTDEENNQRVLEEMADMDDENRIARFVCAAVVAQDEKVLFSTEHFVEGLLMHKPMGDGGFGYDPLFYYPPFQRTFAQVPIEKKHEVSHRGKALQDIVAFLKSHSE